MKIPKELYSNTNRLIEYCVRESSESSLYLAVLLVIDKLKEKENE